METNEGWGEWERDIYRKVLYHMFKLKHLVEMVYRKYIYLFHSNNTFHCGRGNIQKKPHILYILIDPLRNRNINSLLNMYDSVKYCMTNSRYIVQCVKSIREEQLILCKYCENVRINIVFGFKFLLFFPLTLHLPSQMRLIMLGTV